MGPVSFVVHFLVVAGVLAHGVFNGALDVVLGHVLALGIGDNGAKGGVHVGVGASGFYCDGDLLANLCECLGHMAPSFQFRCFAIFKCSSHFSTINVKQ